MDHANVNVNLMVENIIQIKSGVMVNVDASVKTSYLSKRFYFSATFLLNFCYM